MSDVIRLLPDSVANQIAAGEVIQRPASVIKELVENAVDAGATSIQIILRDGGKNLIQVIDNGCGMSDTDARLAFERHATSKIRQASDLFELHTMGFRGEALPSIAAVAQIDLRTMRKGDTVGTHLEIAASKFQHQTAEACAAGTNLSVKNLFFNFPARRKFLKKDAVELTHILHEFERLALVNPDKTFTLVHNEVTLHQLLPGTLKQRIVSLFGKSLEKQLIPVATETSLVKISGFVANPENARKRNALQYFFVNGRNMMHPYFRKAVLHCYENLIPADHQPSYFLNFEVDPQTIDVNIHPTKSEIKFENEAPIWQILVAAIKEALGKFNAVPSIDFDSTDRIDVPVFNPNADANFGDMVSGDYNPFAQEHATPRAAGSMGSGLPSKRPSRPLDDWEKLYEGFSGGVEPSDFLFPDEGGDASALNIPDEQPVSDSNSEPVEASGLNSRQDCGETLPLDGTTTQPVSLLQLKQKYLVVPSHAGLMVVDSHRAHVKVLYEEFFREGRIVAGVSQAVLFPEVMHLTPTQNSTLSTMGEQLRELGFQLEYLGDSAWSINAVPASTAKFNAIDLLQKMIADVAEETETRENTLPAKVALAMARAAAVQPGQPLSQAEAETLLSRLFSLPDPGYTPTGQPVFFTLDMAEIAKRL